MRARTSASHACGSTSLSLAVWIRVYVFAELREPTAAAGRAGAGCRNHDTLARQVIGERPPCGALALESGDRGGLGCRFLGDQIVLGGVSVEILELQLHLIEQAAAAFGAGAVLLALQLRLC